MRRRVVAAIGLLLVVAGLSSAHAATLPLSEGSLTAFTSTRCVETVDPSPADPVLFGLFGFESVRLTVPAACAGKQVHVTVHRANGNVRTTGTRTPAGPGAVTVPTGRFGGLFDNDYAFAVTVDGWYVPNA